jgi:predicted DNA-binding transcriptional regulator AlpA
MAIENTLIDDGFAGKRETLQTLGDIGGSTLYAGMAEEPPRYPRPYRLGANRVGWKRSELRAWCDSRPQAEYRTKEAA